MAFAFSLLVFALASTFLGKLALSVRARRRPGTARRGFVTMHPAHRAWLRNLRLVEPDDFLQLEALIVSGHPGRQVGRLVLGNEGESRVVYLKRESRIRWTTRLWNFLAGFGWVSRCVREAGVLEALERDNLLAPRWLATGEDGLGRAFLLVEEVPGAVPLTTLLGQVTGLCERRWLAARLGETLAKLHEAGFFHRDLYAKHVLVRPSDGQVYLLDWQRAWRGAWIPHASRIRDLATLHATLATRLANPRERLAFLRAYVGTARTSNRARVLRLLISQVEYNSRHLRQRRHIREKRQPPTAEQQAWICLDGESLCITPVLAGLTAGQPLDWLNLEALPRERSPVSHRWLVLPGQRQVLLVRRQARVPVGDLLRRWLLGRPIISPEQRRATLLWRLERHGVPAPRVLAVGRRTERPRRFDSLLLCEPYTGTVRLGSWLERAPARMRQEVLRQLGQLLARLHEACCYLDEPALASLAVHRVEDEACVVLETVEGITPLRRPHPLRASRDLDRVRAYLIEQGCDVADWSEVERGHAELEPAGASGKPMSALAGGGARPITHYPWAPASGAGELAFPPMERSAVVDPPSFWQRLTRGWRRLRQRPDWTSHVGPGWPEQIMDMPVTDRFSAKQGRSTGRVRLPGPDPGQELVIYLKRHYALPFWQGLLATIWPAGNWSPAMQEYDHLEWARQQGVPVPATVAAGEFIGRWGKLQSFLAVEELTDMLPLHEAIPLASRKMPPDLFRRWKRGLVAEMARLARLLHDRRHFHKDLYLCHYYIHQSDIGQLPGPEGSAWRNRVYLIDLHRLSHHPWTWWVWQLKDLAQLLYSADVEGVDARDQLAFWIHYRGPGAQRWSSRWLRRLVVFKWRRYASHNERRKARLRKRNPDEGGRVKEE